MNRSHILALLALIVAVPAAAVGGRSLLLSDEAPCFSVGQFGYRLTGRATADYVIRIDNAAARADLTLQLVDDPGIADFVLADGGDDPGQCRDTRAIRTIRVDDQAREPDLTIALSTAPAAGRYRIYAHAADYSREDAAALFAVMTHSGRKAAGMHRITPQADDITGALTAPSSRSHHAARQ